MSTQTIDLRAASGGTEYTWPLTLTEVSTPPDDISGDVVRLSLGSYDSPTTWLAPDIDVPGADAAGVAVSVQNQRTVQLLVGTTLRPAAGTYYLWSRITDNPEVVPRRAQKIQILADA